MFLIFTKNLDKIKETLNIVLKFFFKIVKDLLHTTHLIHGISF
jgi:hypothetical protein